MKTNQGKSARKDTLANQKRGLSAISICGFKSLAEGRRIEIRPLTLLAGANSSGKSSIMQPILLLKQTLEAPYDPGSLLLDGPNVRITSADQLLSKTGTRPCADRFSIQFESRDKWSLGLLFRRYPRKGLNISEMHFTEKSRTTTLTPQMSDQEIERSVPEHLQTLRREVEKHEKRPLEWTVLRERCFFSFALTVKDEQKKIAFLGFSASSWIEPYLQNVIHVPGLRGNPERTYKTTAVGDRFPGTFENYVASIISDWQARKPETLKTLGSYLEDLGLTWKVESRQVDDTQVELRVGRLSHGKRGGAKDLVSIADVGFGVSQSLPVLVALLVAKPGQLVYLEQPEIHLHPRAQTRLARILADAAQRGVQVNVETHSSLLLRSIQTLVATGDLSENLVKLHWFRRRPDGVTEIQSANLDRRGAFGDWPEDFGEVMLDSEKAYLDAVEAQYHEEESRFEAIGD